MYLPVENIDKNKRRGNRIRADEWNAVCRQLGIQNESPNGFSGDGTKFNIVPKTGRTVNHALGICQEDDIDPYSIFSVHPSSNPSRKPPLLRVCKTGWSTNSIMANGFGLFTNGPYPIYQNKETIIIPVGMSEIVPVKGIGLTVGKYCGVYDEYYLERQYGGFVCVGADSDETNLFHVMRVPSMTLFGEADEEIKGGDQTIRVKIATGNDLNTGTDIITAYNYLMREEDQKISQGDRCVIQWSDYNLRWILTQAECVSGEE